MLEVARLMPVNSNIEWGGLNSNLLWKSKKCFFEQTQKYISLVTLISRFYNTYVLRYGDIGGAAILWKILYLVGSSSEECASFPSGELFLLIGLFTRLCCQEKKTHKNKLSCPVSIKYLSIHSIHVNIRFVHCIIIYPFWRKAFSHLFFAFVKFPNCVCTSV
jgi:hypothetical protein